MTEKLSIAAVVPCYKVRAHTLSVLVRIGPEVGRIYAVDDAYPDQSGQYIEERSADPRAVASLKLGAGHQDPDLAQGWEC